MTPPTQAEQSAALSSLSGMDLDPAAKRDVAYVAMIAEALRRGITWRQIGSALGCPDGKTAKRAAKALARSAQKDLLAVRKAKLEAGGG
jgi:hypothetical protein